MPAQRHLTQCPECKHTFLAEQASLKELRKNHDERMEKIRKTFAEPVKPKSKLKVILELIFKNPIR